MSPLVAGLIVLMGVVWGSNMAWFVSGAGVVSLASFSHQAAETIEVRRLLNGADAEVFTSTVLRRRPRHGWRSIDSVAFHGFDVDHVLAGPGGVFAVETKWTSFDWALGEHGFSDCHAREAVSQVKENARRIRSLIKQKTAMEVDVRPLLVIWGPGRPLIGSITQVDDALVVDGPSLRASIRGLTPLLDRASIDGIIDGIADYVEKKDLLDVGPSIRATARTA